MILRACVLVLLMCVGAAFANDRSVMPVSYVEQGPVIDGKLDDAAWANAKELTDFTSLKEGNPLSKYKTFVRGVYDQQKLYLSFRCVQPNVQAIEHRERDGALWFDDCIELFISPHIRTTLLQTRSPDDQHFHLIVNSVGDQFDELGSAGPASWDGQWETATQITDEGWQVEIAIPFATLYFENFETRKNPPEMTVWQVQFGRSPAVDADYSSLFPTTGLYKRHDGYGDLVFVANPNDKSIRWRLDQQKDVDPRITRVKAALDQLRTGGDDATRAGVTDQEKAIRAFNAGFESWRRREYTSAARNEVFTELATIEKATADLQATAVMTKARAMGNRVAIAAHNPIKDTDRINPDYVPALSAIGQKVVATVTPGEYEAASFVLWTEEPLTQVMVDLPALQSDTHTLQQENVDLRWVGCWYQAGDADNAPTGNVLIPELLLKNPQMVTIDRVERKNIMLDGYNGDRTARGYRDDSIELLPVDDMPARSARQVWLTINVPAGTPAGLYKGTITASANGETIATLPIELNVLGFTLERSMLENNFYAQTVWGRREFTTEERALNEMANLVRHGVDYVALFERRAHLPEVLRLQKQAGMATDKVYLSPDGGDSSLSLEYQKPEDTAEMARQWLEVARACGVQELYFYLIDEGREEILKKERPYAEAIRAIGVKTWVACYSNYFELGGDFIDLANIAHGPVAPELVKKIHDAGKRVFCYANPQTGIERPETYRRNYGLLLWQADYDGSFGWSWYWQFGPNENPNGWDDFNHRVYRDHMMVYATKTNVVDTIQWEGWREAVDDTRYMATLLKAIETARSQNRQAVAASAEAWVSQLKQSGAAGLGDLDAIRTEMIRHINACLDLKRN